MSDSSLSDIELSIVMQVRARSATLVLHFNLLKSNEDSYIFFLPAPSLAPPRPFFGRGFSFVNNFSSILYVHLRFEKLTIFQILLLCLSNLFQFQIWFIEPSISIKGQLFRMSLVCFFPITMENSSLLKM